MKEIRIEDVSSHPITLALQLGTLIHSKGEPRPERAECCDDPQCFAFRATQLGWDMAKAASEALAPYGPKVAALTAAYDCHAAIDEVARSLFGRPVRFN